MYPPANLFFKFDYAAVTGSRGVAIADGEKTWLDRIIIEKLLLVRICFGICPALLTTLDSFHGNFSHHPASGFVAIYRHIHLNSKERRGAYEDWNWQQKRSRVLPMLALLSQPNFTQPRLQLSTTGILLNSEFLCIKYE